MKGTKTLVWFTLLELMIVITIISLVSVVTYFPYAHHQKKVLLKQWSKQVMQSLSEARNLALNGFTINDENQNIALYFANKSKSIEYYVYTWAIDVSLPPIWVKWKTKELVDGVQINMIDGEEEAIFAFEALSDISTNSLWSTGAIHIGVSYKEATEDVLRKNIRYYSASHISDIIE